ncbi:hypothetical protein DEO72_LG8g1715 [Vigna unguiculata]|uniref:Uncharacterized protein n=1 Tax=Vigna unguiculata TaxID=3917 RepID=A0A4D6MQ64_VIGUN|nr:hypothetical protein DEO72_LG8g1715 [Vigna unguiculata]
MGNPDGGKTISTGVSNVSKIPCRPPKSTDFGFGTIVDDELLSKSYSGQSSGQPKRRGQTRRRALSSETIDNEKLASSKGPSGQPRRRDFDSETIDSKKGEPETKKTQVKKETTGSLTLMQLITVVVVLLWMTMMIGVLDGLKVRFQGGISPYKTSFSKSSERRQ